ncbi:MAG: DUF5916 domain-containing protein [Woeseiaceae bacterium]|nr:DUF5916 domain-containing protein [Woeseiaceae bacterium]
MRIALTIAALLASATAFADNPPPVRPEMSAHALESAPVVDGNVLGDPAWTGVAPATGFWQVQPDEGLPASQRTEVYIGFSGANLYVGVVAYDDDPAGIIVNDSRRDTSLDDSDAFLFIIDGMLDRQNGFVFGTNAAGIEYDGQVIKEGAGANRTFGGGGINLSWDTTWRVETRIADYGWSAEFEIPFRSLRFGRSQPQDWGINFQRNIRRNNEIAYWAPLDRSRNLYRVSEAGTLRGVNPPSSRNLQLTPYGLGSAQRGGGLDGTETDTEFGLDLKYSVTPSLTLDATYNTDFAQVEVDEQQVNLDRFNLFFPEKRPFFLENAGLFLVGRPQEVELFFSRRIGISDDGEVIPVDGGVRLSGKLGSSTNVGLLHMQTDAVDAVAPQNRFTVARISQELPNRSSIGAIYTDRNGDGSYLVAKPDDRNRVYGLDGRWGIGDNLTVSGWLARTDTPGLDDKDRGYGVVAVYNSPDWQIDTHYNEIEANFNPELGFLSRTDYRKFEAIILRNVRNEAWQRVLQMRPHVAYRGFWKPDGFQESGLIHLHLPVELRSSAEFGPAVNFTRDGVIEDFEIVEGVVVPADTYDHTEFVLRGETDESRPLSYGFDATVGGRFGGDRASISQWVTYRRGETFRASLNFRYNDFDLPGGDFTAHLARLRLSYSFSPKIQLQALVQYNELADTIGTNIRFSWLQSANSGLFLVYNEVDERAVGAPPTGREFIVKYSHIFDVFD